MDIQTKHELLIKFLQQFEEFRGIKSKSETIQSQNLKQSDTDSGAILLCAFFNLTGGSIGEFNLYELLEAYITVPERRNEVNLVIKDILKEKWAK